MPSLFPENSLDFEEEITDVMGLPSADLDEFKGTYEFDFDKGEFNVLPNGSVRVGDRLEAYIQWCIKALSTARYNHMAYDGAYGQEYSQVLGSGLPRDVIESEAERITREALMVHPFTARVYGFKFNWSKRSKDLSVEYSIETIFGDNIADMKQMLLAERGE